MSNNNYNKNYKKISDIDLQRSDFIARYSPGFININDIYGSDFTNKNTTLSNTTNVTKSFTSGECIKTSTSTYPKQEYEVTNPDGSKPEPFTNMNIKTKYSNKDVFIINNKNNYNFYKYVFLFILIFALIFLNKS